MTNYIEANSVDFITDSIECNSGWKERFVCTDATISYQ